MVGKTMDVDGHFRIATTRQKGAVIVACAGELDMVASERLRDQVEGCLEESICSLVLDCSDVTFLDSMGVKCLLHAAAACFGRGIPFGIVESPWVRRILDVMGLRERLPEIASSAA